VYVLGGGSKSTSLRSLRMYARSTTTARKKV